MGYHIVLGMVLHSGALSTRLSFTIRTVINLFPLIELTLEDDYVPPHTDAVRTVCMATKVF